MSGDTGKRAIVKSTPKGLIPETRLTAVRISTEDATQLIQGRTLQPAIEQVSGPAPAAVESGTPPSVSQQRRHRRDIKEQSSPTPPGGAPVGNDKARTQEPQTSSAAAHQTSREPSAGANAASAVRIRGSSPTDRGNVSQLTVGGAPIPSGGVKVVRRTVVDDSDSNSSTPTSSRSATPTGISSRTADRSSATSTIFEVPRERQAQERRERNAWTVGPRPTRHDSRVHESETLQLLNEEAKQKTLIAKVWHQQRFNGEIAAQVTQVISEVLRNKEQELLATEDTKWRRRVQRRRRHLEREKAEALASGTQYAARLTRKQLRRLAEQRIVEEAKLQGQRYELNAYDSSSGESTVSDSEASSGPEENELLTSSELRRATTPGLRLAVNSPGGDEERKAIMARELSKRNRANKKLLSFILQCINDFEIAQGMNQGVEWMLPFLEQMDEYCSICAADECMTALPTRERVAFLDQQKYSMESGYRRLKGLASKFRGRLQSCVRTRQALGEQDKTFLFKCAEATMESMTTAMQMGVERAITHDKVHEFTRSYLNATLDALDRYHAGPPTPAPAQPSATRSVSNEEATAQAWSIDQVGGSPHSLDMSNASADINPPSQHIVRARVSEVTELDEDEEIAAEEERAARLLEEANICKERAASRRLISQRQQTTASRATDQGDPRPRDVYGRLMGVATSSSEADNQRRSHEDAKLARSLNAEEEMSSGRESNCESSNKRTKRRLADLSYAFSSNRPQQEPDCHHRDTSLEDIRRSTKRRARSGSADAPSYGSSYCEQCYRDHNPEDCPRFPRSRHRDQSPAERRPIPASSWSEGEKRASFYYKDHLKNAPLESRALRGSSPTRSERYPSQSRASASHRYNVRLEPLGSLSKVEISRFMERYSNWRACGGDLELVQMIKVDTLKALAVLLGFGDPEDLRRLPENDLEDLMLDYARIHLSWNSVQTELLDLELRDNATLEDVATHIARVRDLLECIPTNIAQDSKMVRDAWFNSIKRHRLTAHLRSIAESQNQPIQDCLTELMKEARALENTNQKLQPTEAAPTIQQGPRVEQAKKRTQNQSPAQTEDSRRQGGSASIPRGERQSLGASRPPAVSSSSTTEDNLTPEQVAENAKQRRSFTSAQRADWRNSNKCVICGAPDHYAGSCPIRDRSRDNRSSSKHPANKAIPATHAGGSCEQHLRVVFEGVCKTGNLGTPARCLMDNGSTACFIDRKLALKLEGQGAEVTWRPGQSQLGAEGFVARTYGTMKVNLHLRESLDSDKNIPSNEKRIKMHRVRIMDLTEDEDMIIGIDMMPIKALRKFLWENLQLEGQLPESLDSLPLPGCRAIKERTAKDPADLEWIGDQDMETFDDVDPEKLTPFPVDELLDALKDTQGKPLVKGSKQFIDAQNALLIRFEKAFGEASKEAHCLTREFGMEQIPGAEIPRHRCRGMSPLIQEECVRQLMLLINKGFLVRSTSAYASPIHMVWQKNKYRMCIDYTKLNKGLVKDASPIPRIDDLLKNLKGHKFFAALDLSSGYHQIMVKAADRHKTAVITCLGLFEFCRVPFGLCNAPGFFQAVMHEVLEGLIGTACYVYIDDIIVFGDTEEEYLANLEKVLDRILKAGLKLNLAKCKFGLSEVTYLGHIINGEGMRLSDEHIHKAEAYMRPESVKGLMQFLGFANYFRKFIKRYDEVARPLQELKNNWAERKGTHWNDAECKAFEALRKACFDAPSLRFLDYEKEIRIRTDASNSGCGGYLYQLSEPDEEGQVHELPICFFSKSFNPTQQRWSTIEQETYGIFASIMHFADVLKGHHFLLETDHRNIVFLKEEGRSAKIQRWFLALQDFSFTIRHIEGRHNVVADALSRCFGIRTALTEEEQETANDQIRKVHNDIVGHKGINNTLFLCRRAFPDFKGNRELVRVFTETCSTCQKLRRSFKSEDAVGKATAVFEPFQQFNIDFLGPLPTDSLGQSYVLAVVDMFSKYVELIPVKAADAKHTVNALIGICCRYGLPSCFQSDQGSHFDNEVVALLMKTLQIEQKFSIPYRPQTNGMVERSHQETMKHLRALILGTPTIKGEWSIFLPLVQRIVNASVNSSTGAAPTELIFAGQVDAYRGLLTPFLDVQNVKETSTTAYMKKLRETHDLLLSRSEEFLQKARARYENGQPKENAVFTEGDLVLLKQDKWPGGDKTSPGLRGPYKVARQNKSQLALRSFIDDKEEKIVHISNVVRYMHDKHSRDHQREAAADSASYIPEYIRSHREVDGNVLFLVKWKGQGAEFDSEEPFELIRDTQALVDYKKSITCKKDAMQFKDLCSRLNKVLASSRRLAEVNELRMKHGKLRIETVEADQDQLILRPEDSETAEASLTKTQLTSPVVAQATTSKKHKKVSWTAQASTEKQAKASPVFAQTTLKKKRNEVSGTAQAFPKKPTKVVLDTAQAMTSRKRKNVAFDDPLARKRVHIPNPRFM